MIRTITVKTIKNFSKDKEGNELKGKFGPYFKYALDTEEYPLKTIWGIGSKQLDWKAGEKQDIDLEEKGEWLNFKLPKKEAIVDEKVQELEKRIKKLEDTLNTKLAELKSDICLELTGKVQTKSDYDKMTDTGEVIDIPF